MAILQAVPGEFSQISVQLSQSIEEPMGEEELLLMDQSQTDSEKLTANES